MPQTENIGDLLLQQLNDPQKMQQLGQMLSSLGLGGPGGKVGFRGCLLSICLRAGRPAQPQGGEHLSELLHLLRVV